MNISILENINYSSKLIPKFKIDFIFDSYTDNNFFCLLKTPLFDNNNDSFSLTINIDTTIIELSKDEQTHDIRGFLKVNYPSIMNNDAFINSRLITFHHYQPELKTWRIINQYVL